jgi:diguanylate cyclase (GGDEF)-like protein
MQDEVDAGRLEDFLELISACIPLREHDSIFSLMAQHADGLFEFERFNILLCDENRQVLKTVVIKDNASHVVQLDEIQLSEMDLILQTLVTGEVASGSVGVCVPMVVGGRMVGLLCLVTGCGQYCKSDKRLLQFLSVILAGTFERATHGIITLHPNSATVPVAGIQQESTSMANAVSLRMSRLAQHDALTGLPNRWLLNERLDRALALASRHQRRLAVLFLDLDRFKEINDSFGHATGDQVLREISGRLERCVRASDTVCRIGGDEFVVLLAELEDESDATICAEKIMGAVAATLTAASHEFHLTLSIGVGIYPGDGEDAATLLKSADTAMYRAKAEGRGQFQFFRKSMNAASADQRLRA